VPRSCTVCAHDESHQINVALVHREPYRHIAAHYGVSTGALQRHSREHIPELLLKASQAIEVADADELLLKIEDLYREALGVLEAGKDDRDHRLVLSAIDRAGKQLETLAEMRGSLDRRPSFELHLHPEWIELRTVIVQALDPHPEARDSVLRAIGSVDNGKH
jgi:hypothetical protein